ncbi:DUF4388 domain-containing protein [Desulfogranum mediterraneum]|uniref:DUF4388 domain-containing protein n=1 Tax=Desulfogranum mediterraneum TaxID=160661 RepID=UPI000416121E|nr:DUF4388 domain-containing protein [Desulfogranum mediterraneum]
MPPFSAKFVIVEERHCPFYDRNQGFILSDQAVELALGRPSCLILLRELTGILVTLLPHQASGFAPYQESLFSCGGCTGLIKFKLTEDAVNLGQQRPVAGAEEPEAVMSGDIAAISPAELLQVFHMHQKTGRLILESGKGPARVTFREGGLLAARFAELDNQEAIYAILSLDRGRFRFVPGLPEPLMRAREIGDFMMILMEGLKRQDEERG